jgi:hypothetical protein
MINLLGPGPLIAPWLGLWELAWQSPTTGLALLACLPTLLLTGFFLVTRDSHRYQAEPFAPLATAVQAGESNQRESGRG